MKENITYSSIDKMVSLIKDDYSMLHVLSRFGIPLGFADASVEEVCRSNKVDCETFLIIVNYINTDNLFREDISKISIPTLLQYLKQSHIYFTEFCLPAIRKKLLEGIELKDSDISFLIIKLFDEYVEEIEAHMKEEEINLFPIVKDRDNLNNDSINKIITFSSHHEKINGKLRELKNIILKYCPQDAKANLLNAALYDIYRCEEELISHSKIEDHIFLPALKRYSKKKDK